MTTLYKLLSKLKTDMKTALTNAGYDVSTDEKLKSLLSEENYPKICEAIKKYYTVDQKEVQDALSERYMKQTFARFDKNDEDLKLIYNKLKDPENKNYKYVIEEIDPDDTYQEIQNIEQKINPDDTFEEFKEKWYENKIKLHLSIKSNHGFIQTPRNKDKYDKWKKKQEELNPKNMNSTEVAQTTCCQLF